MPLLPTAKWRPLLASMARLRVLPVWSYRSFFFSAPIWLEGLVLTESSGNPFAIRYEPHQDRPGRADSRTDPDTPGRDDVFAEDDKSIGLMQVMGYNLRALTGVPPGTPMDFRWALDPEVNVLLGTRLLRAELAAVGGDVARALARYNGGPTGDDGLPMRVQGYVDKVFASARRVSADQ